MAITSGIRKIRRLPQMAAPEHAGCRHTLPGYNACQYKPLLCKIAVGLGLSAAESLELAESACRLGEKNYPFQKNNFSLKIALSKIVVHHCVFRISSILFSRGEKPNDPPAGTDAGLHPLLLSKIPFSYSVVYFLFHTIGFTETELAHILNITLPQVRERLAKAIKSIQSQ